MEVLPKANNQTIRFKEIISILTKYGIGDWLADTNIDWIKKHLKTSKGKDITKFSKEERVRLAITELGTTFIKFGQILSTRSDLVGTKLAEELSKLQSSTPADGIVKVRKRIKKEFDVKSIDELFSDFSTKPMASASIAQVHAATLISGEEVVVKIMHADIEEKIEEDLKILAKLAAIAERHGGMFKFVQPVLLVRQFSNTMLDELDFNKELNNIQKFTNNFMDDERVVFPIAYPEVSGTKVLTMSFLDGQPLNKVAELEWPQEYTSRFTEESAGVFMDMMFRDRFYHADPHPGNLFVREDGSLGVIDCGMVNKVDQKSNHVFEEIIIGVAQKDAEHIKNTILEICTLPKDVNFDLLTYQIEEFVDKFISLPLNEFDMSGAIEEVTQIIQEHHIIIPPNISSLFRVVGMLEGSSRLLNPNFNIAVLFEKYQLQILKRRFAPKTLIKKLFKNVNQWERIAELLPKALDKGLRKAGSDNFEINLEHRNLEKSVNRIVMGLIASAIFLGSSMLWSFKVPPVFNGYSVFGILGVLISSYLTYNLIKDINKNS